MVKQSKGRSRPKPDAGNIQKIVSTLAEAISNDNQIEYSYSERNPWEVTMSARDGAVHTMRFLRVWFDLPEAVFFEAVFCLDTFLARMKVQEKFLPCVFVSCFHLAAQNQGFELNASQLVTLSQSKCSVKDMIRMSAIITQKLNLGKSENYTTFDLLNIYMDILRYIAVHSRMEGLFNKMLQPQRLYTRLEVLMCESSCAQFRPSILALALIHLEMRLFFLKGSRKTSVYYLNGIFNIFQVMDKLLPLCDMDFGDYVSCFKSVKKALKEYDSRKGTQHRQKLNWRFSVSTHALSKSTQYYSVLNTVKEE